MKKNYSLSFILCCTIGLTAQTVFNPATDYMFCDFESSNTKIMDDEGDPTSAEAIKGTAGLWHNATTGNTTAAYGANPNESTSTVNPSVGCYRYSFPKTATQAGVYINIEGWSTLGMNKSVHDYKSLRFKLQATQSEGVQIEDNGSIGLKVTVGQFKAGGGQKVKVDSISVAFTSTEPWQEFAFDISKVPVSSNGLPYQNIDVAVYGLPDRSSSQYGTYFRIDDIVFSNVQLPNSIENQYAPSHLLWYDNTINSLNIKDGKTASAIVVYNALGQIVKSAFHISRLDISEMASGVYFANALVENNKQILKFNK